MQACDVIRYLALTIRDNCASVKYSDDGGRLDISGAWAYVPADDLVDLRRCNGAIYSGWLAGVNGDANAGRLEKKAANALEKARGIVAAWGKSPAGGYVEIDAETAASAGALVLLCFDAGGVSRRVDLSAFFGRG